jgi:hypothetical protein
MTFDICIDRTEIRFRGDHAFCGGEDAALDDDHVPGSELRKS